MEVTVMPIMINVLQMIPSLGKVAGRARNRSTNRHYPNSNIAKIGQNNVESPRDPRKLAFSTT